MANINDTYFDGFYKDIWRTIIPAELTVKEVDFMLPYFKLNQGSKVLDLMCGYGRHALALAQKGIAVTAVDNLAAYINEVEQKATKEALPVKAIRADVVNFKTAEEFDLAICMGNSLNFFNREEVNAILSNTAAQLKKGGHLLINSWSIAEIAIRQFVSSSWSEIDGMKFLSKSEYLFNPARIETKSTIILPGGATEEKLAVDYIYTIDELTAMLLNAGLQLREVYSIPGRKRFTLGEPRAYIVAEKI